jgi:hypothetical protein
MSEIYNQLRHVVDAQGNVLGTYYKGVYPCK